jgi:hypothetical protein
MREPRVRYIGTENPGVPYGRTGVITHRMASSIVMLKWDPCPSCEHPVNMSSTSLANLEEVSLIPQCERPTRPGMYLIKLECSSKQELAIVEYDSGTLCVSYPSSKVSVNEMAAEILWWGPLETQCQQAKVRLQKAGTYNG